MPARGDLRVGVTDSLVLDAGTWHLATDQHQRHIAIIEPPATPMFQQVVAYLEAMPVPPGGSIRRVDEARAAVGVCLRWGSYFAVLADPSRPDTPNIQDEQISQIADEEMARMNIEISAAIAWWFSLCGSNDRRYWDLVHRAVAYLPLGPKTVRPHPQIELLLACTMPEMSAEVERGWPTGRLAKDMEVAGSHGVRAIANTIALLSWRNAPVEDVHAGRYVGHGLGKRRVLPRAEKAIIGHAQGGLFAGLKAADYLRYDDAWPPSAARVLPFLHPLIAPSRWSYTEHSRRIELPLCQGEPNSTG